jgi:hypothetical protein
MSPGSSFLAVLMGGEAHKPRFLGLHNIHLRHAASEFDDAEILGAAVTTWWNDQVWGTEESEESTRARDLQGCRPARR